MTPALRSVLAWLTYCRTLARAAEAPLTADDAGDLGTAFDYLADAFHDLADELNGATPQDAPQGPNAPGGMAGVGEPGERGTTAAPCVKGRVIH